MAPAPEEVIVGFVRELRSAGVAVPVGSTVLYAQALHEVGLEREAPVYWAGRATLASRPEDIVLYDRYVGQYQIDERQNICTVRREGERLMIRWIGRSGERYISEEVFPQSESVFRNEFWGVQAMFLPAADGQALNLVLTSSGMTFVGTK